MKRIRDRANFDLRSSKNGRMVMNLLMVLLCFSCEEWITVPAPDTDIVRENVFEDDLTALAALTDIYGQLSSGSSSFANGALSIYEGVYADELISYSSSDPFYLNSVVATNGTVSYTWQLCYSSIYSANLIIEEVAASDQISVPTGNQLTGEALFLRAFCHFYLVNLFGDVPMVTTSDYRVNAFVTRTPVAEVYSGIIKDLLKARELLTDTYPTIGRVRANKGAAIALLARACLYADRFADAEVYTTEIINNSSQFKLHVDLNTVFLKNSEEAIWQLPPNGGPQLYTFEGYTFILVAAPPTKVTLRNELVNAFESSDLRKEAWIDSLVSESGFSKWYYAFKYKENALNRTGNEYSMILRLAEQYLIRAEARARQNKLTGSNSAESDINIIRSRAGLPNTSAVTQGQLLRAIEQERRFELFTEWGHRFFDLKRTGRVNEVLDPVKPNWDENDALLPIPQSEILNNPKLKPQNPGY